MKTNSESGVIITFNSYKGGTGRSMALANVAVWLSQQERKKVLMIDWDLEAPGLHIYFADNLENKNSLGLINLFELFNGTANSDFEPVLRSNFPEFICKLNFAEADLSLLTAGSFDKHYNDKVQCFDWRGFFKDKNEFFLIWIEYLQQEFDYVLIDSRTGLADMSGICTMIMPERVVVVFTPNNQSLDNLMNIMDSWVDYRLKSVDLRPYMIYPLPSRVEINELDLYKEWQECYIGLFEAKFKLLYKLNRCKLKPYFDLVALSQIPKYAYGEKISVLLDGPAEANNPKLNVKQYVELVKAMTSNENLWDYAYKSSPKYKEALNRIAEAAQSSSLQLNLSGLELAAIPDEIKSLKSLSVLDLSDNEIEELDDFSDFPEVRFLRLSYNKISRIEGIEKIRGLESLALISNQISKIDKLEATSALTGIDLSKNQVTDLTFLRPFMERGGIIAIADNPIINPPPERLS